MANTALADDAASGTLASSLADDLRVRERGKGWFTRLVGFYLRRYEARRGTLRPMVVDQGSISDLARSSILKACVKSAASGAASGAASTAATLFTAETEGIGAFVAVPVAGLAIGDAFAQSAEACHDNLELLVEGLWFIFTADGRLAPEETATLARLMDKLDPVARKAVHARFVEDELDWARRIESVPEESRDAFLHALEVAACVDKEVTLPERKILRRAAHHLGREFDLEHLQKMIAEFESYGVLTAKTRHRRWSPARTDTLTE
jgi:uncharacterized tellurite resistance protein B-like protein